MTTVHHRYATVNDWRLFYREAGPSGALFGQVGVTRYALYVQDYGVPLGWRLALADPGAVTAIITQNGNGYEAGFTEVFWKPVRAYWRDPEPADRGRPQRRDLRP